MFQFWFCFFFLFVLGVFGFLFGFGFLFCFFGFFKGHIFGILGSSKQFHSVLSLQKKYAKTVLMKNERQKQGSIFEQTWKSHVKSGEDKGCSSWLS